MFKPSYKKGARYKPRAPLFHASFSLFARIYGYRYEKHNANYHKDNSRDDRDAFEQAFKVVGFILVEVGVALTAAERAHALAVSGLEQNDRNHKDRAYDH